REVLQGVLAAVRERARSPDLARRLRPRAHHGSRLQHVSAAGAPERGGGGGAARAPRPSPRPPPVRPRTEASGSRSRPTIPSSCAAAARTAWIPPCSCPADPSVTRPCVSRRG